jgi:hypothetical protein
MSAVMPPLRISEVGGRVRVSIEGLGGAEGSCLQEAADELVRRLLLIAMALRSTGIGPISECAPDYELVEFVWELGEIAAAGGDIRVRLFGTGPLAEEPI